MSHNSTTQYFTTTQSGLYVAVVTTSLTATPTIPRRASLARTGKQMTKRIITAEVDEQWFEILGQITKHQDGFVWIEVKDE